MPIRIRADPDRYQFQTNDQVDETILFARKFQYAGQNSENYDIFDTDEKGKPF
jgi:hypothetical protein